MAQVYAPRLVEPELRAGGWLQRAHTEHAGPFLAVGALTVRCYPQFSTYLPIFLLACRHRWRAPIAIVMIPHPLSSLEPLFHSPQMAMCKNPLHTPRSYSEKVKKIL